MRTIRYAKWLAVVTTGTCLLWGAGGCLPEDFWPAFFGDTIIAGVGSALLASALTSAGL
ncbi:MAG: hypothetical protein HRF43_08690 [Phycisphaerae bacterium]|jgi:hypothetical protein